MPEFTLDRRLESDTIAVGDLALSSVLLLNDARFPWLVLVPRRPGASEITDLSDADAATLIQEVRIATRVLLELCAGVAPETTATAVAAMVDRGIEVVGRP